MTKEKIEQTARDMAAEMGLINITRAELCERSGIPVGSFQHIMGQTFVGFIDGMGDVETFGKSDFVSKRRLIPRLRREHILAVSVRVAEESGYIHITRIKIAEAAGVSPTAVSNYFHSMNGLRTEIMSTAVAKEILPIIAQGLVEGHPLALSAPPKLKNKAARSLTT